MKKIFITAVGGDIGYGIIKALKSIGNDLYIIGCDIQHYNFSLDIVDEFLDAPRYNDEKNWLDFVLEVIEYKKVDYFLPVTEDEIKITDRNRDMFSSCKLLINHSNVLDISLNKWKTALNLADCGVDTPKTWDKLEKCEKKYPLIVKEMSSCGSHGVYKVSNEEELIRVFSDMQHPIIQSCVGNADDEYTMAVFSDCKIVNAIAFRRILGFGGMTRYVELVNDNELLSIANKIARYFKLKGSINIQMRKVGNKYYVFEINPRISSTIGFRYKLGFNDIVWWIDMVDGKNIPKYKSLEQRAFGVRNVEEKIIYGGGG